MLTLIRTTIFSLVIAVSLSLSQVTFAEEVGTSRVRAVSLSTIQLDIRKQLAREQFDEAIKILVALRSDEDIEIRKFAQEFLGVTRERKGQYEFAALEYRQFLEDFPHSVEVNRVKARLDALIAATLPGSSSETVTADTATAENDRSLQSRTRNSDQLLRGSISVGYRNSSNENDAGDSTETLSLVSTDVDLRTSADLQGDQFKTRLSLGHYEDLLSVDKHTTDRIRYLYADYENVDLFRFRVGRQRSKSGAIYGRFDGLDLRYQSPWKLGLSFFAGLPVESSKSDLFADDRRFLGVALDSGDRWGSLKLSMYGLHQVIDSEVDRQTIGSEFRYVDDGLFAQGRVDFDIYFGVLNSFLLNINRTTAKNTSINASYSFRKSPYLSTRNALIGQGLDSVEDLKNLLTGAEDLESLAIDRSLDSQSITLGFGKALSDNIHTSGSLAWLSLNEGVTSGGVTGSAAYDQVYGDARVSFQNLFLKRHTFTLGIRFASQDRTDVLSFITSSSFRVKDHWSIAPRFRVDRRDNIDGSEQLNLAPALRVEYQNGKHAFFLQTGYLLYTTSFPTFPDQDFSILFSYLSYQYRF